MTNRRVLSYPDSKLAQKAAPVQAFDQTLASLIADLIDTLEVQGGIGVAAPQIGVGLRVLVVKPECFGYENPDTQSCSQDPYLALVNPEIVSSSAETIRWSEACLSVPGASGIVARASSVRVKYQRANGVETELEVNFPFAGVLQHEIDHLEGRLYIDHLGRLERDIVLKKLNKISKAKDRAAQQKKLQDVYDTQGPIGFQKHLRASSGKKAKAARRSSSSR